MTNSMRQFILLVLFCAGVPFLVNAGIQETNLPARKQVLFICTGNYYRSRFSEALFNYKARQAHLDWNAISRGLKLVPSQHGISALSLRELIKRGVPKELCQGDPKALTKKDLEQSDYIVLMDEAEHRPMLEHQFQAHDDPRIHYWHIGETGKMPPSKACQAMFTNIDELLRTLER